MPNERQGTPAAKGGTDEPGAADVNVHALVSYKTLRAAVGTLGILLPLAVCATDILLSGQLRLQESICDYYATPARNIFVGTACVIGMFLFAYKGYERADDVAGDIACFFALGVAFFPNSSGHGWVRIVHLLSALGLFATLAYFSHCLFVKGSSDPDPAKLRRNRLFRLCGRGIVFLIVLATLYVAFLQDTSVAKLHPIFWLECGMLWLFGLSWAIKGEVLKRWTHEHADG